MRLTACVALALVPMLCHAQEAPAKVPSSVMAGALVKKVPVNYPLSAKAAHISGKVVLRGVIGKDGKIKSLQVVSGAEILADPTVAAVRQWEYRPYLVNGEPVEVETTITTSFAFDDSSTKMAKPDKPPPGYTKVSTQKLEDLCVRSTMTYPSSAKEASVEGDVPVQVVLGTDGTVESVKALGGPDMLREDAERFVRTWRCVALKNGKGVPRGVEGVVSVAYRLR